MECDDERNHVVICCNAMICGNVEIGNNVMIAAGAFADFDVSSHSLVIGNPGIIHTKVNAAAEWQ